ncbi:hypothetical protein HDF16_000319 [Granulicella aggregans]|uniref:Uncharacterized protein n=1 Tax=Granulicella aggregans TaxID=474949 RepID=A0A7W7Z9C6_9BACT|nr:hypothetical protein [Granulicella aggregans]MBB5055650.1 hypothetical protein [Granulicella aggregans]
MSNVVEATPELVRTLEGPSIDDQPFIPTSAPLPRPAGEEQKTTAVAMYYLQAEWKDDKGNLVSGYTYPVGVNASTSFWDYVVFVKGGPGSNALKFYLGPPDKDGWSTWHIKDDDSNSSYHLDCKATGWLYRGDHYGTKFQIVDNHLHCSYWNGPAGSEYRSTLVSAGQYLGMDLPAFTCSLKPV